MIEPELLSARYRLAERIGAGAVAEVWRGIDTVLLREVAIKTIDIKAQHDDPEVVARFRREAVATAGLSHPNIVTVYDTGLDGDLAFLVMELLTGPTLQTMIRDQGFLSYDEGLGLMRQVSDGLAAAHAEGIIHRDIKPGNVMLHHGEPKIVDFGIAALEHDAMAGVTAPGTAIGTPAYISPEQALGRTTTPASDMYSFGCLLMALFSGRPPFQAEQPIALARAHITDLPPRLSELRPDCPPALDALVEHLLSKDPADRPGAGLVSRELQRIAANLQVSSSLGTKQTAVLPVADVSSPNAVAAPAEITDNVRAAEQPRGWLGWLVALLLLIAVVMLATQVFGDLTPVAPGTSSTPSTTSSRSATRPVTTTRSASASQSQVTAAPTSTVTVTQTATLTPTAPTDSVSMPSLLPPFTPTQVPTNGGPVTPPPR